ncbi:hypothetical protein [Halorhodospira halophila]|uniref:hypothetical protein n=1 Tax=Halorhodospira halophila TaxID=1053 RepID=UPI001913F093|nr:hypothetical protein [Halorhodospira halophila]MBK5936286.1 hypothetical protein [Halorhodospira halophila]
MSEMICDHYISDLRARIEALDVHNVEHARLLNTEAYGAQMACLALGAKEAAGQFEALQLNLSTKLANEAMKGLKGS